MKLGVLEETSPGERRVALVPETVRKLRESEIAVLVERGAGLASGFLDRDYETAGATLVSRSELAGADALVSVTWPPPALIEQLREGAALIGLLYPLARPALVSHALRHHLLTIALDMLPRTAFAQSMDVLSSQANLAGYWAVIAAAARLPKIFPLLMTAAGTIVPARVLIMGAGVAGLQAIGTARRLGAVVEATDVRPETKEQVESLGGRFLCVEGVASREGSGGYAAPQSAAYEQKQRALVARAIAAADVVITTALVPGRRAPRLVTAAQLDSMRPGSVLVDLAAEQGGNIEGSEPGREVEYKGLTIIGARSPASNVAVHASTAFSRNVERLLQHLARRGEWQLDFQDEVTAGCVITHQGEVAHPRVRELLLNSERPLELTFELAGGA